MSRWFKRCALLLPLLLALVTLVDTPYHWLTRGTLTGIFKTQSMPQLSFRQFWAGQFQGEFEKWFEQQLAFKPALVRTDNTVNLLAFADISAHTAIPIILGKDNTLFEMNYVNNSNDVSDVKGDPPPKSPYPTPELTARVGRAARAFRSLGIDFMVVFYPSKGWLWRDRIPSSYRLPGGFRRAEQGYADLLTTLRAQGVTVIDGAQIFSELATSDPSLPLYNRGGTHWTQAAACQVAQQMVLAFSDAGRSKLRCKLGQSALAHGIDADLANLINVWDNQRFLAQIPASQAYLTRPLRGGPRDALVVGTSFSEHLVLALQQAHALGRVDRLVYYRHSDAQKLNFSRELARSKLVVFEQWQSSLWTVNVSDFLDDLSARAPAFAEALRQLDAPPAPSAPPAPEN